MDPAARAMLDGALADAKAAAKRVAVLEARLAKAKEAAAAAARKPPRVVAAPARPKVKIVRERVVDDAAVARAERRADAAAAQLATAKMDAAEARSTTKRLAARLERAEATIGTLRDERRDRKAEVDRLADRLAAVERLLDAARAEAAEVATRPAEVVTVREEAPEAAAVRAAEAAAERSRRVADAAELRAATAERELRETVAAVRGEARRLTAAELAELHAEGPSGPGVLAGALGALAAARKGGNPVALRAALRRVAEAAVTWGERL